MINHRTMTPDGAQLYATKKPTEGGYLLLRNSNRGRHGWTLDGRRFIRRRGQWELHPLSPGEISPTTVGAQQEDQHLVGRGTQ